MPPISSESESIDILRIKGILRGDVLKHAGIKIKCINQKYFLISQHKHMLWVLKRIVLIRQLFKLMDKKLRTI